MNLNTRIMIERGEKLMEVNIEGIFYNFGSMNPKERGWGLEDFKAFDHNGKTVQLTQKECDAASEKLYEELNHTGA